MRRAALERPRTLRVWRRHLAMRFDAGFGCREPEPGRFRKGERVGGCGTARCWQCHAGKLMGDPTRQALRAMDAQRDGLLEYLASG